MTGYDPVQELLQQVTAILDRHLVAGGEPVARLRLESPDGTELLDRTVTAAQVSGILHPLNRAGNEAEHAEQLHGQIDTVAALLVEARRAGEDVGELLAAGLQQAAKRMGELAEPPPVIDTSDVEGSMERARKAQERGPGQWAQGFGAARLVRGRPGSWEAGLVLQWAKAGGKPNNPARAEELAKLLVDMCGGYYPVDGGDALSQAMGRAVDRLGSMAEFVGRSRWRADLENIGGQYAGVSDGMWGEDRS